MKKSIDSLIKDEERIRKNIKKTENISPKKVSSSKNKYKENLKAPEEYKESHIDTDKDALIDKLFFVESQLYYLETANDKLQDQNKKLKKKLEGFEAVQEVDKPIS